MSNALAFCFTLYLPLLFASKINTSSKDERPNFVFFLTDDQDVLLGGFGMGEGHPLPRAIPALRTQGTVVKHWFAHTPVCCPSRAEILTGRMFHNLQRRPTDRWDTDGHGHPEQCMHINESALSPGKGVFLVFIACDSPLYICRSRLHGNANNSVCVSFLW